MNHNFSQWFSNTSKNKIPNQQAVVTDGVYYTTGYWCPKANEWYIFDQRLNDVDFINSIKYFCYIKELKLI